MHRLLVVPVLVALIAASGCGGSSESTAAPTTTQAQPVTTAPAPATTPTTTQAPPPARPARLYTRADLGKVALRQVDVPASLRFTKAESGLKTLFEVGIIVDSQVRQARRLGFQGVYDAIFDATNGDLRLASRLWLFRAAAGASRWLAQTETDSRNLGVPTIPAPPLGDESFAAAGGVSGSELVTHAFRVNNLVVVVSYLSQQQPPSRADALAAARKAYTRATLG